MTKIQGPSDPRLAPFMALRVLMPLPGHDSEERDERKLLRRAEVGKAVRK